jgi:hypothetical protein
MIFTDEELYHLCIFIFNGMMKHVKHLVINYIEICIILNQNKRALKVIELRSTQDRSHTLPICKFNKSLINYDIILF